MIGSKFDFAVRIRMVILEYRCYNKNMLAYIL